MLADNTEEVKKITLWLKEFNNIKFPENLSMIRTLEELQGKHKVIKFLINQKSFITINFMVGDWSDDVICLMSLLLSTKVFSSIIFDLGWQQKVDINHNCKIWVQCAIEHSVSMFQIFKWELLDGIEMAVQSMLAFRKS